jgi:rhodanese-related sulfurtransferase
MPITQAVPAEAHKLIEQGHRYVDVRTEEEFANGHASGALNIPVAIPNPATGQMALNNEFIAVVEAHFPKDAKLVLGCQSGMRSERAAEMLSQAGYTTVVNLQGGFGGARDASGQVVTPGWAASGLSVSHDCPADASYAALLAKAK